MALGSKITKSATDITAVAAWIPRALGGWGLPNMVQWLTRESLTTLEAGLANCATLIRSIMVRDPGMA